MADQLCTTAAVKTRAGITDADDDALISSLIDGVSDWVQDFTGRKLVPDNAATYVVDTTTGPELYVRRGIRTLTTLEVAATDQPSAGGTYATVAAALCVLRPAPMYLRPGWPHDTILILGSAPAFRTVINGARIVGNFGFATTPPVITELVIDAVVAALGIRGDPAAPTIGADGRAIAWSAFFGEGTAQLNTLLRYRGAWGIA